MRALVATALASLLVGGASSAAAPSARLVLPYDLEARGGSVYIADGLRHQILRYDLRTRRLTVFAGTGVHGSSGDGGTARRARLTEPTEIVFDRAGNLYFSDVNQGRVRRIDRRGIITTVARVPAAAGVAVDPSGRFLAIASIEGWVYRVELATGARTRIAGDGTQASSGDGGPAAAARLNGPHDVTYDAGGNLLVTELAGVRRIDARTGTIETAYRREAFKVVAGRGGTLFVISGDPGGGRITELDASGAVRRVIGTGRLSPHRASVSISRVGFLPSDVEPVGSSLLIAQTRPVPAVRRLGEGSSTLTTLVR
jgi:DNA-binding beta-propeller fold protein YncE